MKRPKLEDFKREVWDGEDYADWYKEYYIALEKYTNELEKKVIKSSGSSASSYSTALAPYRCPICGGNGIVLGGFYNQTSGAWVSTNPTEECRSCGGTGILWSKIEPIE